LRTTSGPNPCARGSHAAFCIAGPIAEQEHPLLVMVGGSGGEPLKDMWVLDIDKGVWSEVTDLSCILFVLLPSVVRQLILMTAV